MLLIHSAFRRMIIQLRHFGINLIIIRPTESETVLTEVNAMKSSSIEIMNF